MKVKVLITPHFEIGDISCGYPGEAQFFFDEYMKKFEKYTTKAGVCFYYNPDNQIALCVTGSGKVNTTLSTSSVLSDERFDFSDAYILSTGCCGGAIGYSVPGDVIIVTAACDYELGHRVDVREKEANPDNLWYHDSSFDNVDFKLFDKNLTDKVYECTESIKLESAPKTREILKRNFKEQKWAQRMPKVIKGTSVSGDNYWKGVYGHQNAEKLSVYYNTPDPYAATEMEDIATAVVAENFGMLDRLITTRVNVNTDVFLDGETPDSIWNDDFNSKVWNENNETLDIFVPAMRNNFKVGKKIINMLINKSV